MLQYYRRGAHYPPLAVQRATREVAHSLGDDDVQSEHGRGLSVAAALEGADEQSGLRYHSVTTDEGVLRLLDIAQEYHAESRYSAVPFSREKFLRTFGKTVRGNNVLSVAAELHGLPVGLMGAKVGEYFLGDGMLVATNYIFYVSPRIRGSFIGGRVAVRLMRIFVEWARSVGAAEINIHAVSGITPSQTDKFLRSVGFEQYGGNYARTYK